MMAETCLLAEAAICYPPLYDELRNVTARPTETVETVAFAAVAAASEQGASAILVLSTSGNTARLLSKYRPAVPIIAGRYSIHLLVSRHDFPIFSDTEPANFSSNTPSPGCVSLLVSRAQGCQ
jgi:pyruvate kinase